MLLLEKQTMTSILILITASCWEKIKWKSFPGGFYDTVSGKMKTMADGKKVAKGENNVKICTQVDYYWQGSCFATDFQ